MIVVAGEEFILCMCPREWRVIGRRRFLLAHVEQLSNLGFNPDTCSAMIASAIR